MVDLYVCLIINSMRVFSDVPVKFQPAVHTDLLALGLDNNGFPLPVLTTPIAPTVSADDVNNVIVGANDTMEYAEDGATTYTTYSTTTPPDLSGAHTINIRVAAVANVSNASLPTTLTFTA